MPIESRDISGENEQRVSPTEKADAQCWKRRWIHWTDITTHLINGQTHHGQSNLWIDLKNNQTPSLSDPIQTNNERLRARTTIWTLLNIA